MKKKYICPEAITVDIEIGSVMVGSGGVNNGSTVGNNTPTNDDEDNIYSNSYRNNLWN